MINYKGILKVDKKINWFVNILFVKLFRILKINFSGKFFIFFFVVLK